MAAEEFSNSLPEYSGDIENSALRNSLNFLHERLGNEFRILKWSDQRIAVPIKILVDIPPLGNYDDIDIRPTEPVILVFNLNDYPTTAPQVFTDRTDFPKDKLALLYIAVNDRPPAFCYVRGNTDEWYANKLIQDLLIRISNWLRDAAAGELNTDGGQFEPLRLEGYSGTNTYDYDLLATIVAEKKSFLPEKNWAMGLFERVKDQETTSYSLQKVLNLENATAIIEQVDAEKKKDNEAPDKKHYHYGYILWSNDERTFSNYKIELPENWEQFKSFCSLYNIDYENLEEWIATTDGNYYVSFPVMVAVKRPTSIIGFSSNTEFVNFKFRVDSGDVAEKKITTNIPIKFQSHNQPLTTAKARAISGNQMKYSGRVFVFGCGALGSKIVMHFGRSGFTSLTLIDPDILSPHNLVRHVLSANEVGVNKAFAVAESLKKIFPTEKSVGIISGPSFKDGAFENPKTFDPNKWIFDFTASEAFFNKLVMASSMNSSRVFSASISDFGDLGILFKEGENRNPRIDDLQAYLYSQYKVDVNIQNWLARESESNTNNNLNIQVGIGCNSETTVLSDDKISSHAAYFSGVIRHEMNGDSAVGKIALNQIKSGDEYLIETKTLQVEPFDVYQAINDQTWEIRFKRGILDQIVAAAIKAKRKETGGVFVGIANHKTKVIHVIDLISAPPDSKANSVCFYRGHQNLPQLVNEVTSGSGGQIGYIGEWHSHPQGPNGLSTVDMETVARFKDELSTLPTPLPVFLTVVTPAGVLPFVF